MIPKFFYQDPVQLMDKLKENGSEMIFFFYVKCAKMFSEMINEYPDSYKITYPLEHVMRIEYRRDDLEDGDFLSLYLYHDSDKNDIIAREYSSVAKKSVLAYRIKEGENIFLMQLKSEDEILSLFTSEGQN